jgi:hypothetical protein
MQIFTKNAPVFFAVLVYFHLSCAYILRQIWRLWYYSGGLPRFLPERLAKLAGNLGLR